MKDKDKEKNEQIKDEAKKDESVKNPFFKKMEKKFVENVMGKQGEASESDNFLNETELVRIMEEKEKQEKELEDLKSQYLRLAADFDNYRKRQAQERQGLLAMGAVMVIEGLLPTLDSFDRAYESFKSLDDPEKIKESFNVLYRQLQDGLTRSNVTKIKTAGELFDPNFHEAVMQEETTEHEDNMIVAELQCGYMYKEKVVRPSMVRVACNVSGSCEEEHSDNSEE